MMYGEASPVRIKFARMAQNDDITGTSQEARAARVILLQEAWDLTRTEFATRIGERPQTVYNWETTQSVSTRGALSILRVFGVSTDWLLAGLEYKLEGEAKERIQAAIAARMKSAS